MPSPESNVNCISDRALYRGISYLDYGFVAIPGAFLTINAIRGNEGGVARSTVVAVIMAGMGYWLDRSTRQDVEDIITETQIDETGQQGSNPVE
jgi:hypothetical protein